MNVSTAVRPLVPLALATTLAFAAFVFTSCSESEGRAAASDADGVGQAVEVPVPAGAGEAAAGETGGSGTSDGEPSGETVDATGDAPVTEPGAELEPDVEVAPEPVRFERLAVIGASATAGFGLGKEVEGGASLADLVERAAPDVFGEVLDLGDGFFFQRPDHNLEQAIVALRAFEPDVIVGVDVQFWFGYGAKSMDLRVKHLGQCLTALDEAAAELGAHVLVGDFPDVRDASFLFMPPAYEPDDATLVELNETVRAWCDEHERFSLVPMGGFVDRLKAGEPIELRGRSFDTSDKDVWLQPDRLHPTLFGTAALALLVLDVLERESGLVPPGATLEVEWEPAAVADALRPPVEAR